MGSVFPNRFLHALELQDANLPNHTLIEVLDDKRVVIENHIAVTQYDDACIQVRTKFGQIQFCGKDLQILRMMYRQLTVTGQIHQVIFRRGSEI